MQSGEKQDRNEDKMQSGEKQDRNTEDNETPRPNILVQTINTTIKWVAVLGVIFGTLYFLATIGTDSGGANQLNALMMRLTILFGAILIFVGWNIYRKIKYQKAVLGRVYCEFITTEGNSYHKLFPIGSDGLVEIKAKKNKKGMTFALDDLGTYESDYPPGKWSFLQTKVKKALLDEESFEPLSNRRGIISLSPVRLANLINERFSSLGVAYSQDETAQKGMTKSVKIPSYFYIILGIVVVGIIAIGYFVMTKWGVISANLGIQ